MRAPLSPSLRLTLGVPANTCMGLVCHRAIALAMDRGAKTLDVKRVLAAAKLIRRLRSVMLSGNWEWVGGVLADARVMRDTLPVPSLKELQVRARAALEGRRGWDGCCAAREVGVWGLTTGTT